MKRCAKGLEAFIRSQTTLDLQARLGVEELQQETLVKAFASISRFEWQEGGSVELADAIFSLGYLFAGTAHPGCLRSLDTDASGAIELSDAIYLLQYLFVGEAPPPEPFRRCGLGDEPPRQGSLSCESYPPCN
jgi:hypothetical protein